MRRIAVAFLVIAGLLLSACGPAMLPEAGPATGGGALLGLPRIVVTVDETGKLGIEGFLSLQQVDQLASSLGVPLGLSSFSLPPELVRRMMLGGIQHLEIRQTADKLVLLFDGKPMPSLSWKDGSFDSLEQLLALLGPQAAQFGQMIQKVAPLTQRLGLSIALKFPTPPGTESIPFATEEVALAEPAPVTESPTMVLQLEVKYNQDGVPSFLGIPAEDVQSMFGGQQVRLALDPQFIERAQANNIQHLELRSKGDGLWIYVNGTAVPPMRWDKQTLSNAIDAWVKMNPGLSPLMANAARTVAPFLSNADLSLMLHFPLAPGAEPIPVRMQ
jgi:hypothetical protein